MSGAFRLLCARAVVLAVLAWLAAAPALAANPFSEGMVAITFDGGWATQYTQARPALNARGIRATHYLVARAIEEGWRGYMTEAQVRALIAEGNHIGSNTLTHPDLTALTPAQLAAELSESRDWLVSNLGLSEVSDFCPPYGRYDATVLSAIREHYGSSRAMNGGRNFRDTYVYELRANDVLRSVPVSTVRGWIDRAMAEKSWLILVFHDLVDGTPVRDLQYSTANFTAILDHLQTRGVRTVTVAEGLALMEGRTEPPPSAGTVVYDDVLGNGFADWSWAEHDLDEGGVVHDGVASVRFEPDRWKGLYFHHQGLDLSQYQSIELWVHGGATGSQQVKLDLYDGSQHLGGVGLDEALGRPLAAGTWQKISIPLSSLGASSGTLRDIYLQAESSLDQGTLYVDDLVLVPR